MNIIPPPDLEPDEEPITELAALIPAPDQNFSDEVTSRLSQRSLGVSVATVGGWLIVVTAVQMFIGVFTLLGLPPEDPGEDQ